MKSPCGTFHDAVIDFLPDATFVIDLEGRVTAWNHAMEEVTGVPAESMLGKGRYEYAVPFYGEQKPMLANLIFMPEVEIEKRYDSIKKIGDTLVVDIYIENFRPGGVYFWAKASPIYDPQGNIIGAIETIRDITDRKRAEQAMVRLNRQMSEIIDFLPDATFVIDLEGRVTAWNHAMEEVTGVPAESMLGKGRYEYAVPFYGEQKPMLANLIFMPEAEIEKRYDTIEKIGDTLVVDIYIENFRPGGVYFWAKASPIYDPQGNIIGAIETIRDITDRKRAEQAMIRLNRQMSEIIDFLPDATFVIDLEGRVTAWNHAMEEVTGVPSESMLGKGRYEYAVPFYGEQKPMLANLIFMPEAEIEKRYDTIEKIGDTLVVDIYIENFRPGGVYFWAKASPIYDPQGNISGAIQTIRDITDRKRAEQEIVSSRRSLSDIINFLPDATLAINLDGVALTWNRAMEDLTGISKDDMIGKGDLAYSLPFYKERRPMLADLILRPEAEVESLYTHVKREGDTLVVDTFIPHLGKSGRYFWAKASPLYDPQGKITGAIETIRDITERREMEGRLARSNAELQIAAEIQQSFMPDVIPQITGFDIAARSVMAKEVGGDFFDVIPFEIISLGKGTLGLLVADVSGKGVPAALFMALSRIVVRVNVLWHRDPAQAIYASNNIISQDSKAGMFVTLFYGMISEKDSTLTYVNAGHNPPMVYRARDGSIEELMPTGIVLGAVENREYFSRVIGIESNDIIVMYTDGVTESINQKEELFGEDRLRSIISSNARLPAVEILVKILDGVREFTGDMPQFDDITLMVIKKA
nr:PAS domain S-box protein [uncultured Methanoregula sp.]